MAVLPEVIKVGPFLYKICADEDSWHQLQIDEQIRDDENWGFCQQKTSTIYINPSTRSLAMRQAILIHELFHAIIFVAGEFFGKKRQPEFFILHTAPLWLTVLQDNPQLVEYLQEGVEYVDTGSA